MKLKVFCIISFISFLILTGCSSSDLYRFNYPDDPGMQDRMEKDFGDFPLWNNN